MGNEQIEDIYLLTPMQQGILFHTLLAPGADPYFVQTAYTIRGRLDADALAAAGQSVVERHPVLRSTPVWEGRAKPVQVVWRRAALPFQLHDWRGLAPDEQERRFESLLAEDVRQGFDLKSAPLMRHTLVRLSDDACKYVLSNHHLLLDGWSSAAVLKEMLLTYEALRRGVVVELGTPRPFRDYIAWLRRQDADAAQTYWRARLRGFRAPTPLGMKGSGTGAAHVESPEGGDGFAERRLRLGEEETARLREFARKQQVTLNTLTQCAWALLLSRYSGEEDVAFGSVVSGRPAELEGADDMVGLFINTLPVRARVDGSAAVGEWLRAAQAEAAEARRYEYSPLAEVQRWSEVAPGSPLFESVLVFENYPVDQMLQTRVGDLTITGVRGRERTGYPLTFIAGHAGDRLGVLVIYDGRRFDGGLVEDMLRHFATLLEGMSADPGRRLSELTLLSDDERAALLHGPHKDAASDAPPATINELFEAQAARAPHAVALTYEGRSLTYAELSRRADRMARRLRALGVGPESIVGLLLGRSPELLAAMLGVLKTGAAYLPLDPSYPRDRLEFMLADSGARALIADRGDVNEAADFGLSVIYADDEDGAEDLAVATVEGGAIGAVNAARPRPDNLAYVIYTSGSTGRPKGVGVTHANVTRLFVATRGWFGFGEADVWALFHSPAFDFSVWEMWGALLYGGRLVVVPYDTSRSPEDFHRLLGDEGVTVLNQTPSAFRLLARADESRERADLAALRLVIFGGEALELESLRPWFGRHGDEHPRLVNMYGITETTVHVTYRPLGGTDVEGAAGSVIGRELPDLRMYILDRQGQPVPVGVAGEIYVGGAGLARGYLNRPGLTAERFVPDPFSPEPGARLYRSGDAARHLPGGDVEYLGRVDQQVKVRGHRIELGEIESALARHPSVREVVVEARGASAGEKTLAAYVVCREGPRPTVTELRLFAGESLPDYMIPSAFVFMDALPLTTNGKVDRRALPDPDSSRPDLAQSFVAPSAPYEAELAELWAEVLGVERVGVEDNFFDLGGHSLLLMQLHGKVREKFETDVSLVELFEYPTVQAQAQRLSGRGRAEAAAAGAEAAQGLRAGRDRLQRQRQQRQSAS